MRRVSVLCLTAMVGLCAPVSGWDMRGHYRTAEAAGLSVPPEVPAFFRWGASTIAHAAVDPDVMKHRDARQLRHREYPEHYLDFELLGSRPLPPLRYDFVALVIGRGRAPDRVGFLPWAVTEHTQRLTLAFAELRCWPDDPAVQAAALVYAGLLAHYATDMTQPLHTTVHYDGRVPAGGESPRSGIHGRVDTLFEQAGFREPAGSPAVAGLGDVWPAVEAEFFASHSLVDRVYTLEPQLDALYAGSGWGSELQAFAGERYSRAVGFLASLYLTAWRQSADIELSPWLAHRGPDGAFEACPGE
jgi:hypothetical protein